MFWQIFSTLCTNNGTSPTAVVRELGISSGSITHWKNGKVPHHEKLIKIANYFNVSIDYLLGKEEPTAEDGELQEYLEELKNRPEMRMLFSLAKGATKEDVEQAVAIIEALRSTKNG